MSKANFKTKLTMLINEYSLEDDSDTPDFILARFIEGCLKAFNKAVQQRETWYVRDPWSITK